MNRAIDNPNHAGVTLYSCPRLGSNCAQCLSLPPSYRCSYCPFQGTHSCSFPVPSSVCMGPPITAVTSCDLPVITSFSPMSGPNSGGTSVRVRGTNLATKQSEIEYIKINGIFCNISNGTYVPGVSFTCEIEAQSFSEGSDPIRIKFSFLEQSINSTEMFSFVIPNLDSIPAAPSLGPVSGGTRVTIRGIHLNVGSNRSVMLANMHCEILETSSSSLVCLSSPSPFTSGLGLVTVIVDKCKLVRSGFTYHPDPTFSSIQPKVSFFSGGTNYTITGTNLHVVQEPRLLFYYSNEEVESSRQQAPIPDAVSESCWHGHIDGVGITMTCMAPQIPSGSAPQEVRIGLQMDGVTALRNLSEVITVHPNPEFAEFKDRSFSSSDTIELTVGSKSGEFVFTEGMVEVVIEPCKREKCPCININVDSTRTSFSCFVEVVSSLPTSTDLVVMVKVGNYSQTVGQIRVNRSLNTIQILIPVVVSVGVLFLFGTFVFVLVVSIFCYRARQKDHHYNKLIMEMERFETSVAHECKLGFSELQTDLDELTGDMSGFRLPYHDLPVYLLASLFPGAKDHPVLHEVQLPVQRQISYQRALRDFRDLCMDKKVLLILIRSMEEQTSFSILDKSQVGSLLMVALYHRLDYATEILKTLLTDVIHRAIARSHPKLLLRRTESVAERMLTNWLGFCLHGYITEHAGKPLYLLYRAVKSQLEKGPIDVITGEARYSLSEHKLIRQKMDVEVVNVTVESDDDLRTPVKLLDCDTVSQAKEKVLDAIYKATPISQRPALTSVDLEYLKCPQECVVLRDEDGSTELEGDWKRINTLHHYCVKDGAVFRIMKRRSPPPPGRSFDYPASLISSHTTRYRALSEAEDGMKVWHLFKQSDAEDPRRSPFLNKKLISEVYLPRMLSTKNILQKFVDNLFNTLFSVSSPTSLPYTYKPFSSQSEGAQIPTGYVPGTSIVPIAVKYMLDFLDDMAKSAHITDTDVVHSWKNNALALRFWVNMIKNPEFIFDINKSHTVDACLSVIAQAFIDGCSSADVKLTIDSPTNKLLYNKEVRGYKQMVRQYYDNVARLPRVSEDAMQGYLKQLSAYQTQLFKKKGGLVVESALYELLRYAHRYHDQFLNGLRVAGLESRAQVFESILRATM